jgi:hypothetical protein
VKSTADRNFHQPPEGWLLPNRLDDMKPLSTVLIFSAFALMATGIPAKASCYGEGYSRYCDGNGGIGATYSNRGSEGRTTYYNSNGGYSRTETYRTTPSYGGYSTYGNTYR